MSKYTANDFAKAELARHPDGRIAVRTPDAPKKHGNYDVWAEPGKPLNYSDEELAVYGWSPVQVAGSYTRTDEDGLTLLMVQQQRDQATARAEKAEKERDEARGERDLYALRAKLTPPEQPRGFTGEDITDEMVGRGYDVLTSTTKIGVPFVRELLTAALTVPTRPEGAEEIEALIRESDDGTIDPTITRKVADFLASRGVTAPEENR